VISIGKLSGAVGTFAHLPPSIEADVCRVLDLLPAPVASQVIQRDATRNCCRRWRLRVPRSRNARSRFEVSRKRRLARSKNRSRRARRAPLRCRISGTRFGCEQIVGAGAIAAGKCRRRVRKQRALARAGHLAFLRRARSFFPTVLSFSITWSGAAPGS
jgi:adenylosuccinate lyase